jgi:putative CocE/NonD family hydrolase
MTPYNRAQVVEGRLVHALSVPVVNGTTHLSINRELNRHGYVIAQFDVRGQGASFGSLNGHYTIEEAQDACEVIAWLCAQPWCSGAIGMLGSSYAGGTQFLVAAEAPPGLKALFACHSFFDNYDTFFPGGLTDLVVERHWGALMDACAGRTAPSAAAPVDGTDGPALLAQAVAEHQRPPSSREIIAGMQASRLRDASGYFTSATATGSQNLWTLLPRLRRAPLPCYHYGGFNDFFPRDTVQWFCNWRGFAPAKLTKLTLGPWTHGYYTYTSPRDDEDLRVRFTEALRWFDHWLKGVDNGVLDEPPVNLAVQTGHRYREGDFESPDDTWTWRAFDDWPADGAQRQRWFFGVGQSGSVSSVNDGSLRLEAAAEDAAHTFKADATVGTGPLNRMAAAFQFQPQRFPEMSSVDARCLTFTTEPLSRDLVVLGVPRLEFHATADVDDASFVVWVEDVDTSGRSTVVSHGSLRASHRALGTAPYDTAGALWHDSSAAAVAAAPPLNAGAARIEMSLLPLANRFLRGHRVRLTISGGDAGNLEAINPGTRLTVWSGPRHPAYLDLPLA